MKEFFEKRTKKNCSLGLEKTKADENSDHMLTDGLLQAVHENKRFVTFIGNIFDQLRIQTSNDGNAGKLSSHEVELYTKEITAENLNHHVNNLQSKLNNLHNSEDEATEEYYDYLENAIHTLGSKAKELEQDHELER